MLRSLFFLLLLPAICLANKGLVNVYSAYSEIHGGTEDSGTQRTETYLFVAYSNLTVTEPILLDGRTFQLHKGDSLYISYHSTFRYAIDTFMEVDFTADSLKPALPPAYTCHQRGKVWYINIQEPHYWPHTLTYTMRKETFTATTKRDFDVSNSSAAP